MRGVIMLSVILWCMIGLAVMAVTAPRCQPGVL
jgi:hypothetical protein